jgi:hypothetical protein
MPTHHPFDHRGKPIFLRKGFLIPLLLVVAAAFYPLPSLKVRDIHDNRVLFMSPVSKGETFEIRYIHSVERVPVAGIFRVINGNRIEVEESIFSSYGAGLPSDTPREDVVFEGNQMRVRHRDIAMERLRLFISPFTQQQFIHSGTTVDLSSVKEGHIVEIRVRRVPLLWCWGRRFCDLLRGGSVNPPADTPGVQRPSSSSTP